MAKKRKGSKRDEHTRVRDLKAWVKLRTIAAKLSRCEPLDDDESVLAGNLLHMVARNVDPRPHYHEPVPHAPKKAGGFWKAMHYRLVRDFHPDGSRLEQPKKPADVAAEIAEAWGYVEDADASTIYRIEREHRAACDEILADANDQGRHFLLLDMQREAEEARKSQGKK